MEPLANGEQAVIVSGGVIMNVKDVAGIGLVDIEADRLVIWTKGANPQEIIGNLKKQTNQSGKELELYLSGHVEVRQQDPAKPGNKKDLMQAKFGSFALTKFTTILAVILQLH